MALFEVLIDALQAYFESLEALGTTAKARIQGEASNDDQARENVDESYDAPIIE